MLGDELHDDARRVPLRELRRSHPVVPARGLLSLPLELCPPYVRPFRAREGLGNALSSLTPDNEWGSVEGAGLRGGRARRAHRSVGLSASWTRDGFRTVQQSPRTTGHFLQPSWSNPAAFEKRIAQLVPYVEGKSLLDVGCTSAFGRPDWIHGALARAANRCVGVDIDPESVARIADAGYDVRLGDAEVLDLDEQFDVVHAGELIEHLDNPHAFLQAVKARIAPDGILVLTTPNVFAVSNFVYRFGGSPKVNADHTCWYCEDTLGQLLERNGYEVSVVEYLEHDTPGRGRAYITQALRQVLPRRLAWNTLLVVACDPVYSPAPDHVGDLLVCAVQQRG